MELPTNTLSEFLILVILAVCLSIAITGSIWLHLNLKYRPDEPCGNDIDNEYKGDLK